MDQFYFEDGYLEAKYFVYIGEAKIDLTPYIEGGFIDASYWEYYGVSASITAELELVAGETVEASGSWSTAASISATGTRVIEYSAAFEGVFTPTLTADAFKNHTAVLDNTSSLSVDAVANRAANVLLDYLADLNAQSVKTARVTSSMATVASQATTANTQFSAVITLSNSASITCILGQVQEISSEIDANSSIFTSKYFGTNRPRNVSTYNDYPYFNYFNTSYNLVESGTHGIYTGTQTNSVIFAGPLSDIAPSPNESWVISFSYLCDGTTSTSSTFLSFLNPSDGQRFLTLGTTNTTGSAFQLSLSKTGQSTVTQTFTAAQFNTHRIAISYHNGYVAVFRNGSRQALINLTALTATTWTGWNELLALRFSLRANTAIDELHYSRGTYLEYNPQSTSVTYTGVQVNDPLTTQVLWHFDNNGLDDIRARQLALASLQSDLTVTAIGSGTFNRLGSANLTTDSELTVLGGLILSAQSALSTEFTQSTTADRFAEFISALTATVDQSVIIGSIKQAASNNLVGFTSNIDIDAQLAGVATIEVQTALSADAVKTTDVLSNQSSNIGLDATVTYSAGAVLELSATVDQTATGTRIQQGQLSLDSEFAQTVEIDAINRISADLSLAFTQSAIAYRIQQGDSALDSEFTQTTAIEFTHNSVVALESVITQSVVNDRIRNTASDLDNEFDYALDDILFKGLAAVLTANLDQTASAIYTADAVIDQDAIATQLSAAVKNAVSGIDLDTASTLTATVTRIRELDYGIPNFASTGLDTSTGQYYISAPSISPPALVDGFTVSFWAKRDTLENDYKMHILRPEALNGVSQTIQFIDGVWTDAPDRTYTFSNAVRLAYPWDADEPIQYWQNAVATDIYWHHYLIRLVNDNPSDYQLWVDGVQQTRTGSTNNIGPLYNGRAYLGTGGVYGGGDNFDGALSQIWGGVIPQNQFAIDEFYQGTFVDLGANGRGLNNQLPQPQIYNLLSDPWTGLNDTTLTPSQIPLLYTGIIGLFTLGGASQAVLVFVATLPAESDLTVLTSYNIDQRANLDTAASLSVIPTQQIGILSDQSSEFTLSTTIDKITGYTADLDSTVTLTARGGYELELAADLFSDALLETDFDSVPPTRGEAQITAEFTLTADVSTYTDAIALVISTGTLTADVTVIPPIRVEADLAVTATLSAIIGEIEQFAVLVISSGTLNCDPVKTTDADIDLSATANINTVAKKFTGIVANWSAFYSNLTAGDVINLDPSLTYQIPQETREYQIIAESREYSIDSETRELIILKG